MGKTLCSLHVNSRTTRAIALWYLLITGAIYSVLLWTAGIKTALLYLGSGKPYNQVLISFIELPKKPPENSKRIFFFGDSTIAFLKSRHSPPALLQEELEKEYGKGSFEVVSWAFGGASMFHYYCLACKAQDYSPSLIIFDINYRSYSQDWRKMVYGKQDRIMGRELAVVTPLAEKFDAGLISPLELEHITPFSRLGLELDFWETCYVRGIKLWLKDAGRRLLYKGASFDSQRKGELSESHVKWQIVLRKLAERELTPRIVRESYPPVVPRNHPELLSLEAFTDALNRRHIPYVAYLTPLNLKLIDKYGAYNEEEFHSYIRYIEGIVSSHGGIFLDLSDALEPEDFQDRIEHYKPPASAKIISKLAPMVKQIISNDQLAVRRMPQ